MWPSAVLLSHWLVQNAFIVRRPGIRCLELGAGCGLVGLVAGRLGASSVILTDFNQTVLRNLEQNVQLNDVTDRCKVVGLDFYQQLGPQGGPTENGWLDLDGNHHEPADLVFAADMICNVDDAYHCANAIHDSLRPDGRAICVCATSEHRFGVDHFEKACRGTGLKVQKEAVDDMLRDRPEVLASLHRTSGYVEGMQMNLFIIDR